MEVVAESSDAHRPHPIHMLGAGEGWSACRDWLVPHIHDSREEW